MFTGAIPEFPLDKKQTDQLQSVVAELTVAQLQWVSGYAAGLAAAGEARPGVAPPTQIAPASGKQLTVLYGSQTGNGERVAEDLARQAEDQGFAARSLSLADFKPADLKRESLVTFVISTHGDGDPPDDAELFHEYLLSSKAPSLPGLRYAVLALGDSSYANFCQTGREVDERLAELGAERLVLRTDCDLDYEAPADAWLQSVITTLPQELDEAQNRRHLRAVESSTTFDKRNPFPAEVLVNQKITGAGSSKDVRHIELSIEDSGICYEAGDSLAVVAENPPLLVQELLTALRLDGEASVVTGGETTTLLEALSRKLEITAANLPFLNAWAEFSESRELRDRIAADNKALLSELLEGHQIIDVVRQFPGQVDEQAFVDALRNLSPRSYSIASSLGANPDEVHLTVAAVRYDAFDTPHWGAASTHLADRLAEGDRVSVYVEANKRFRLPEPERPIIMIGPGTGVAPFRAFVEERAEQGAGGDNWLFFGDRNSSSDFLYQLEWQRHLKNGHLTRMDVAFSRDQQQKIYVQQRIAENAAELHRWMDNGAAVYVCGDAKRMAIDVHDALVGVLETEGLMTRDAAEQRLKEMRRLGHYQRDIY
ncbi:MAG: assimilatory sulfite reductase (NADPH) flavoprotein subunit [Woeseiaceae bacterium]